MIVLFGSIAAAAAVLSMAYRRPLWALVLPIAVLVTAAALFAVVALSADEPPPAAPPTVLEA